MRKFLYVVAVLLLVVVPAQADNSANTPHSYIARAIDSVCKVEIIQGEQSIGSGSGFVVSASEEETQIITARHVLENASKCRIYLHGHVFESTEFYPCDDTDAGMIFVRPGIPFAKALKFNLSSSNKIIAVNAFGYWGMAKIPGTPQILSMQSGWADRKVIDAYGAPDYRVIRGIIMANVLIFPGDSGGPILDNNMQVVGVNIILSKKHTMFVDSRYLWNTIAHLNKGRKVSVPYDYEYDVLNTSSHQRIRLRATDEIENDGDKTSFSDLRVLICADIVANGRPGYPTQFQNLPADAITNLFNNKTILHIGDKKYLVASLTILAKGLKNFAYTSPYTSLQKYVYFPMEGAEVVIELAEFKEEPSKDDNKTEAFMDFLQNLSGRHLIK